MLSNVSVDNSSVAWVDSPESGETVVIQLPELASGEEARVHHAAAWRRTDDEEDVSTWFAVDIEPLQQVYPHLSR